MTQSMFAAKMSLMRSIFVIFFSSPHTRPDAEERYNMAEVKDELFEVVPHLLKMPSKRIWIDYDDDADVLYISFQKPQNADESEMDENIIYHYQGEDLVGITVIGAKKYGVKNGSTSGLGIGLS